ncbi:transposase [Aliiroseovarius zhejiangensis]|uniref:transposase n=1 Tax=Aliiroseovarius zhejiangensis TaxID=1632025 RepID=UPI00174B39D8
MNWVNISIHVPENPTTSSPAPLTSLQIADRRKPTAGAQICRLICRGKCAGIFRGVFPPDHVHIINPVPLQLAVSDLVRLTNGRVSHRVQRELHG